MKHTPLRKVSKKRSQELIEYRTVRKNFLTPSRACEVCFNYKARYIHHKNKRNGARLLDEKYFLPVCANCHRWIHENPKEATERGYLL